MNVAELQAALEAAKKREREEGDEAWKALAASCKGKLDWEVKWLDRYTVSIHTRYRQEVLDQIQELDSKYQTSYRRIPEDQRKWHGMTYIMVGDVLVQCGGRAVLDIPHRNTFIAWRELTDNQEALLRAGFVPDSLKSEYFK